MPSTLRQLRRAVPLFAAVLCLACGENRTFPEKAAYQPEAVTPLACVPNLDGKIDAVELKAALDVPESLVVSPAGVRRTVDLAGVVDAQGRRTWNFATDYADDQIAKISASALTGKWFAASFPNGQYVAPVDLGAGLLGVYSADGSNLLLHGLASSKEMPAEGKTLLVYNAPVAVHRYPLEIGKNWISVGLVQNGMIRGLPYAGRDTYQVSVDAAGRLDLADLTFTQALRIRTRVTVEPAVGASVSRRQVSFFFECFGEVARASSVDNEPLEDFTTTAELRRLGL
jgi:hypothetical protein